METQNFEKKLTEMTKPEIPPLKHQDMLAKAIINAKDKSVVSWWWLSVPGFIVLMLIMKSLYMPGATLVASIHDLANREKYISIVFFLVSPVALIVANAISIRRIYFLSGSPKSINFLETIWLNILIIVLSVFVLIVYSL
jgi:hypothetical protein